MTKVDVAAFCPPRAFLPESLFSDKFITYTDESDKTSDNIRRTVIKNRKIAT